MMHMLPIKGTGYETQDRNHRKTDPVLTVSIHQNSYPEEYVHGAQVFYYTGSMGSETLASGIQDQLVRGLDPENHRKVKANAVIIF